MPTRNIVVTERQAKLIEELVASGEYQNASEVLREGLRLVEERRAEHQAKLKLLREAVQLGIDDIEAGRFTTFHSAKEIKEHFAQLRKEVLAERHKSRAR